jgi:hypothetical protein
MKKTSVARITLYVVLRRWSWLGVAAVGLLCTAAQADKGAAGVAPPRVVLIIRHAEKPDDPADVHLAKRGDERAAALPQLFIATPERPEPFATPDFLFATRQTDKSDRPVETVKPLSMQLKLPIDRAYRNRLPDDADGRKGVFDLADEILGNKKYSGRNVLICWHHGTIPELAGRLGATGYPRRWRDAVFDRVWQITYDEQGKTVFANRPQKLLPGDSVK